MAQEKGKGFELIKKQFIEGQLSSNNILSRVLSELPPEDVTKLRLKAAEGKLGLELEQLAMINRFDSSSLEIREFIENIKDLESATRGTSSKYEAEGEYKGASGRTRITVKKGCYIATAIYGSDNHPNVKILKEFRDEYLENNLIGRIFCSYYYKISPVLARSSFVITHFAKTLRNILDHFCIFLKNI